MNEWDYIRAKRIMLAERADYPQMDATQLATLTALELGHDEWLDDETHWIWELAVELTAEEGEGDG